MIAASMPATLACKGIAAEPSLPPSTPFVTRFVTPATVTAGVIRPRRILERLPDGGESISLWAVEATRLSLFPREPARHLTRVIETCGFLLKEVDEIGYAVQYDKLSDNFFSVFLLRFSRTVDPELVGDLFRQPQVKNIGDIKTFRQGPAFQAAALVDDRSLLICPAPVLDGLLATGAGGGPIHDAIESVARDSDMAAVFSPTALPATHVPAGSLAAVKLGTLSVRFGARPALEGTGTFSDSAAAARGAKELPAFLRQATAALDGLVESLGKCRPGPPADALAGIRSLAAGVARWAGAIQLRCENDSISFTATSPADAGFPADVGPLLILPDVAAAAEASRAEHTGTIEDEDPTAADESVIDESIPSHWRSFDAAASGQARRALFADPVAIRLRNRLPAATGFDSSSFISIIDFPSSPARDLPDQPVSLLPLTANWLFTQKVLAARDRSFMVYDSRPSEFCLPFLDTLSFGYASSIRVEDVTEVACQVSGDTATGTAAFASNTARGELRFKASRVGTSWNFTEFQLPGWLMQCTRQPDGTWSLRSDRGPYGKEPLGNVVELSPTLDGAPLKDVRLLLYREPQLDVFDVQREDDGRLTVRAPPGRYLVQILGTTPPPPPLDEDLRADGPTVTLPADPPRSPLPVELNVRKNVGNRD